MNGSSAFISQEPCARNDEAAAFTAAATPVGIVSSGSVFSLAVRETIELDLAKPDTGLSK